jgi:hypothetical protein
LTIRGGTARLLSIDAPNLQELRLYVGKESGTGHYDPKVTNLNRCTLRPQILHMDLFTGIPGIQALLKALSAELQELNLTLLRPQHILGSKLTADLYRIKAGIRIRRQARGFHLSSFTEIGSHLPKTTIPSSENGHIG